MITLRFTGNKLLAFGVQIPATCIVRRVQDGTRGVGEVLRELNGHVSTEDGTPYMPDRFPAGAWEITGVISKGRDTYYWPVYLRTNAHQTLEYWDVNRKGEYTKPNGKTFEGYGYGLHYARYKDKRTKKLVHSNTTLGCINILDPERASWLGKMIEEEIGARERVYLHVPPHDQWEA